MILHIPDYEFEAMYESARHNTPDGDEEKLMAKFGRIVWATYRHQVELERMGGRE